MFTPTKICRNKTNKLYTKSWNDNATDNKMYYDLVKIYEDYKLIKKNKLSAFLNKI